MTAHNSLSKKHQAWSGLFSEPVSVITQRFTASIDFDQRLWREDIQGSLAHAKMLCIQNVISAQDLLDIERGMAQITKEIESGQFEFSLAHEDIHLNIEKRLTELVGEAGKRLHTGRSRNDQVALDVRLYTRRAVDELRASVVELQKALLMQAKQNVHTILPGFTHLQVAQPVSFEHHCLAYVEMLMRDAERLIDARKRVDTLPLGAAALAGTTFPIDRDHVAKSLGFARIAENSLDAVSDRDFVIEVVSACATIMMHLSRLSEELVLWMNPRFAFVRLPDRFTTGSSIMPQKKNPDVAELIRGKTGRVYGHLMGLLTLMKGQALAYNKDNQEDKEPLFDTVDTVTGSLRIMAEMLAGLQTVPANMRAAAMEGYATATDLADYLVRKGMAFREAHEVVALAVKAAQEAQKDLSALSLKELQTFSGLIGEDVFACLSLEGSLAARDHFGGTAPRQVEAAIARAYARLSAG
ncbi:MAG: hypothetical protein RLZZ502_361 [Pseudomonadota bacterium]